MKNWVFGCADDLPNMRSASERESKSEREWERVWRNGWKCESDQNYNSTIYLRDSDIVWIILKSSEKNKKETEIDSSRQKRKRDKNNTGVI